MNNIYKLFVAATCYSSFSYAGDIDNLLELSLEELMKIQVVTAASGFEQKTSRAPATVTIISAQEWQRTGARFLSDVLLSIPGVHAGKSQADYRHKKFFIRGLSGYGSGQIKLLIDGEPFESIQDNSLFLGLHLPLTNFKRIEVIKGPGSAIYGADAFAGVINLVSYEANEIPATVGARWGSFNTYDLFARGSNNIGDSYFQWSFDYTQSDDDKNRVVNSDLQSVFDSIFNTSASRAPGPIDEHYEIFTLLAKWQYKNISLDYYTWRNFDYGNSAGVAQALDPDGSGATYADQIKMKLDISHLVPGELTGLVNYQTQKITSYLTVFPAGTLLPVGPDGNINFTHPVGLTTFEDGVIGTPSPDSRSITMRLTHLFDLTDKQLFRWEFGYEKQYYRTSERKNFGPSILDGTQASVSGELTDVTGTPFIYLPDINRDFKYLSLLDEWQVSPKLQLTFGIRHDRYSDFGSTTNPRLSVIWQISDDFTMKVFSGSAFRAPSIAQLYARNNPASIGNPDLHSASVDTIETGINLEYFITQNFVMSLNAFSYQAKDLIAFVFDEQEQVNIAQNTGEQKGQGGELWLKWKPQDNISIDANYSFLQAKDEDNNDIADVPTQMAYLGVNWQFNDLWVANTEMKWLADRKRPLTDTRKPLANYLLINSKLERKNILPNLSISLIARNILNKAYAKEPSPSTISDDYPIAGQQLLLEINYQF
ncbi:TonB-dependent receptor [Thalassotalea sp. G2M2-11]|uniref:TonB-dependent receptor plug domain-containing protein n=1 Tax=Thalassotalea sp. G2M2-11 TaxID=2787627 RepID=UPI0019D2806C|nr:TonB-dependent receptor [Thalassotalea sp. G2M2-11]